MFHILQNSTILLHWKLVQFIGAVYSAVHWLFIKYKEYSAPWSAAAAAAQLIYFCAMNVCLWPTPLLHKCASQIAHCTIVQSTHMCVTLNCATWNAQCAGGDFVQCVIKNLTVLSQNLDDPYYLCISMCSCRCKMFAHVQVPAQSKPSWEKSSQGGGIFSNIVLYFMIQKSYKIDAIELYFKVLLKKICHNFTLSK